MTLSNSKRAPVQTGALAPQQWSEAEILAKMREGTKSVHEIRCRSLVIPVRILSIDEVNQVRRESIMQAQLVKGDDIDKNVAIQRFTLKLASQLQPGGAPVLTDKILSQMSVDEVNFLYNDYIVVSERVNPSVETISDTEFRELVDALKKNHASANDFSLLQLKAICGAYQDLIQRQDAQKSQKAN
jgi:hypothetical protein